MTTPDQETFTRFKEMIRSHGIEESFLKASGVDSLDEVDPKAFAEFVRSIPPVVMEPALAAGPIASKELDKSAADAKTGFEAQTASDILKPYIGLKVNYGAKTRISTYPPSSLLMDFLVHHVNNVLVDSFYFRRASPDYHPYILRLYFGVLFWIQSMRAMKHARTLDLEGSMTLRNFLEEFPPESLPIPSPLLGVFKTLCCSQPEIPTLGLVCPTLPHPCGPALRSTVFLLAEPTNHIVPNVPGIFALLEHLQGLFNPVAGNPVYPDKGQHIPVPADSDQPTVFGHVSFPPSAERTAAQSWSLCSSGLQYQCEADRTLHRNFAERIASFDLPPLTDADDLSTYCDFLSLGESTRWFTRVRDVAAVASSFFEGSGTLADAPPFGIRANQVIVEYQTADVQPATPTRSADPLSLFPFRFRLRSSARMLPETTEAMAASTQTNADFTGNHPFYAPISADMDGPFWDIRPNESSEDDDSSFLSFPDIIRGLMKS